MPRPIWKGSISFGLVNVPVTMYSAEKRSELHFNMLDRRNGAHVRYKRVNEVTGEEVPWEAIAKGFELEEGDYVLLEDEDFQRAAVEATQTVEIVDFVDRSAIEYVYFDKPYYLVPGKRGEKGYVLLREALRKTGRAGVARVVMHTRQHLAAVIPEGNGLVLAILRFWDELRDQSELNLPGSGLEEYKISMRELEMAMQLVAAMSAEWEPQKYRDEYRQSLLAAIEEKARTGRITVPPEAEAAEEERRRAEVIDIMELLKRSVEATKERDEPKTEEVGGKSTASRRKRVG